MFPIPWNFPFRKKNGDMSTIGDVIGGAGSELPPHSSSDAGKLLGVKPNGSLEWSDTVNSEIQTLTNNLEDEVVTRAKLGAHNLLPHDAITSANTVQDVTYTPNSSDFSISISGTAAATHGQYISNSKLYAGTYKIRFEATGTLNDNTKLFFMAKLCQADGTSINNDYVSIHPNEEVTVTIEGTNYLTAFRLYTLVGAAFTNSYKIKPMIRLASDPSTDYAPYAMTNRELTEIIDGVSNGYVCVDFAGVVEVTADGTKTEGDLYKDLADAFLTYLGTLTPDIKIEVVELSLIATAICDGWAFYTSSSTSVNIVGRGYGATSSGYSIFFAVVSNTAGNNKSDYWVGSTSENRYSDKLTTVPTSGTKRKIIFRKYKKIS